MDENLWLEKMRWRLSRKFVVEQPGKQRSTRDAPSFDTSLADKREALMNKRREGVFQQEPDGTLSFLAKTPHEGTVRVVVDPADMDLADNDIWRVMYCNGSPFVVSRFFFPEFGALKLTAIIAQRKYGNTALGRITHANGDSLDCTRSNLISTSERITVKEWVARIKEWLRFRRRERKVTIEMEKSFRVAKRREKHEAKIKAVTWKPKKYEPTFEELSFDAWIGAWERAPGHWRAVIKSPRNMKPWEPEIEDETHDTEAAALAKALALWLPYVSKPKYANAVAHAKSKVVIMPSESLKDAAQNLLGDFKNEDS